MAYGSDAYAIMDAKSETLRGIISALTDNAHNRVEVPRELLEAHMSLADEQGSHEPGVAVDDLGLAIKYSGTVARPIGARAADGHNMGELFLTMTLQGYAPGAQHDKKAAAVPETAK